MNNLTNYISASVYKDSVLRERILAIYENEFKTIAPSYGLDMDQIVSHCYRAKSITASKNYILFVLSILFLIPIAVLVSFFYQIYIDKTIIRKELLGLLNQSNPGNISNARVAKTNNNKIGKNIIYYDGFSPFVGFGVKVGGWSFAVDIDKPQNKSAGYSTEQQFFLI